MAQGKRERARDSRGRPIPGLYVRDGKFSCGYQNGERWQMVNLRATTITEAKRERESLLAGMREGRVAAKDDATFLDVFNEWQASREISEQTQNHEALVLRRYLSELSGRRIQDVTPSDLARILRGMRGRYSSWTQVHAYKVLVGVFSLATRRELLSRNPLDGLSPAERPKQRNKREVARLDAASLERLVAAGGNERWRAALSLAAFAGLRAGEIRAVRWGDVDLEGNTITITRSALPNGQVKAPKTRAGIRVVPLLPGCRRRLVAWKIKSPKTDAEDLIIGTAEGKPIAPENLRRAMTEAKANEAKQAKKEERDPIDGGEARLSLHSLRHSYGSMVATDLQLAPTTVAQLLGHTSAEFSMRAYARDARSEETMVADVLVRAQAAGIGG